MIKIVKKIMSLLLVTICLILGVFIIKIIKEKNAEYELISGIDDRVIEKLQIIRTMEKGYYGVNNAFTSNWDSLQDFVQNGKFVITDRREEIIVRPYGGDSILVLIDTLGVVPVQDSLFKNQKIDFKSFNLSPESNNPFKITTIAMGNNHLLEVIDVKPLNPDRQKGGKMKPLKFGSMSESTLRGNWEK